MGHLGVCVICSYSLIPLLYISPCMYMPEVIIYYTVINCRVVSSVGFCLFVCLLFLIVLLWSLGSVACAFL